MRASRNNYIPVFAALALFCVRPALAASAAPLAHGASKRAEVREVSAVSADATVAPPAPALDLRAPLELRAAAPSAAADASALDTDTPRGSRFLPFPATHPAAPAIDDAEQLPRLGNDGPAVRSGRLEQFAQRVQREGLPVARLFETRSALLSIGLSPRGKPGLWLIQKVR